MAQQDATAPAKPAIKGGDYVPDKRRMQLLWLALGLVGLLTIALVLVVAYGLEISNADYTEPLLLIGLLALVTCTVEYFAD